MIKIYIEVKKEKRIVFHLHFYILSYIYFDYMNTLTQIESPFIKGEKVIVGHLWNMESAGLESGQ